MRVAIQMLYTDSWLELAKVTVPNIVNYCRKHDYRWSINRISEPYNGFTKLTGIKNIFDNNDADVVWSFDCDTLVTNYDIKLDTFIDEKHDAFFTTDINGLNCGIFAIKKSDWSLLFLEKLLSYKDDEGMECEQNAVDRYIQTYENDKIKIIEPSCFNDYPLDEYKPNYGKWRTNENDEVERPKNEWAPESFIIHVPGLPFERRLSILKNTPILR